MTCTWSFKLYTDDGQLCDKGISFTMSSKSCTCSKYMICTSGGLPGEQRPAHAAWQHVQYDRLLKQLCSDVSIKQVSASAAAFISLTMSITTASASNTASRKMGEAACLKSSMQRDCRSTSAIAAAGWKAYSTALSAAGTTAALSRHSCSSRTLDWSL